MIIFVVYFIISNLSNHKPQYGYSFNQQQHHGQPIGIGDNFSWQDPQIYIKSLTNTQDNNYHDIVDFVSASGTSFNDETLLSYSSTRQLIFKSGPSKPKLELISLCQWSMASLAILYKMLEEGS
jgi:hypothetical protein